MRWGSTKRQIPNYFEHAIQIHACSWYRHLSEIGIFPFSQVAPSDTHSLSPPSISREENQAKNNQNSCSLSKILVCNLSIVPFNRSIANSSNSSKVMLSVGGTLYICKPCVCFLAFCELSRGLVRLLLFFRLPEKSIFLGRCMWLWERYFWSTFFPPND